MYFSKATTDKAVKDAKEVTLIALFITIVMSFIEIPILMAYYVIKFVTAWVGAAIGYMAWRLIVWVWNKAVSK